MAIAARKVSAPPDDAQDRGPILDLIAEVIPDPQRWLTTANNLFGGQSPQQLIGTPLEHVVRNVVLRYKYGMFT